jgi:site-specific recombinase XerD
MFETIYSRPADVRRHERGPLSTERSGYLRHLGDKGAATKTLQNKAWYVGWVAAELRRWPNDHLFTEADFDDLSASWAQTRPQSAKRLRSAAADWLLWLGRLAPPVVVRLPYDDKMEAFIKAQREERELSAETCNNRHKQVRLFLSFVDRQGWTLPELSPEKVDAYFQHIGQKWGRSSIKQAASSLRAWFRHCERQKWTPSKLADVVLSPRIYRYEGLPRGPTWDEVRRVVVSTEGEDPMRMRDRAILLLLAVYGLRSGELRRLCLDDIDWKRDRIRVTRSKVIKVDTFPLEPSVGNAVALYIRRARPRCSSRTLFLTMQAPFRSLSLKRLHEIVTERFAAVSPGKRTYGPQELRHACAQHLLETGHSFKEIGDHLGHRDPVTTRIYAKVDLDSLRRVAMESLGGLA